MNYTPTPIETSGVELSEEIIEQAEQGTVLEVCLDEIERCRSFFIGVLGKRYGWVPNTYDGPDEPSYIQVARLGQHSDQSAWVTEVLRVI